MALEDRNLVVTKSQAACLIALRDRKDSTPKIAVHAKLDMKKTAAALGELERLGLAKRDQPKKWHATARGKICLFETVPDRSRRDSGVPGPGGQRLLKLLNHPMPGREIAERLGITKQGTRQLLIKLHAQGRVNFADPERPFWLVARTGDKTPILSRDEERVLSAIPPEYATDAGKISLAAGMPESKARQTLESLIARRFVEACAGFQGGRLFRITAAGQKHPQYEQSARRSGATPLGCIRTCSQSAFGYFGFGNAANQRRLGCHARAAPIDQCAHAVSQAKAFGRKDWSGAKRAVCVDRRRPRGLGGNDATASRIVSIPPTRARTARLRP